MIRQRRHAGRIAYRDANGPTGMEDFAIDVRPNGRTIRAYCEMNEGALTRDASWTTDAAHNPVEAHVRVVQHGNLVGSTWYCFDEQGTHCEAFTSDLGRTSTRLPQRPAYVGLHPLVGDGMIALNRGTDALGEDRPIDTIACSRDINGETELQALPMTIMARYIGEEEIEVPAGRFAAHRYELRWQPEWPPAHVWVHGPDAIFLRMQWDISAMTFELARYACSEEPHSPQFGW